MVGLQSRPLASVCLSPPSPPSPFPSPSLSVSLSLSPPFSLWQGGGCIATALVWKSEDSFQDSALFSPWFLGRVSCFYHVCHRGFLVESEWPVGCLAYSAWLADVASSQWSLALLLRYWGTAASVASTCT